MRRTECFASSAKWIALLMLCTGLAQAQDAVGIDAELDAVRAGLAEAYNEGDLDLLLSYCHDDVIAIWQDGVVAQGHEGVRKVISELIEGEDTPIDTFKADPKVTHRAVLANDTVVVSTGKMNDIYSLTKPAGTSISLDSVWSVTLAKFDDRWLVVNFHCSANAFDNEVITLYDGFTRWTSGVIGGVIGLVLGALGASLFLRRKGAAQSS
ncbi:MAG: nuclear transport factor 2 family protein [Planctomycetales bacterium]|nr:nuclear transport factor 2 family protein [Planctomycetales bacterium]